jgi:hypothetical protein
MSVGVSVPSLILDPACRCELHIWRALAGVLDGALVSCTDSEIVGTALERVSSVIGEQVERLNGMRRGEQWTQ